MNPAAQNQPAHDAKALLAQAEEASTASVSATEPPRGLLLSLALICAAIFSLHGVINSALWYWSLLLFLAPLVWYIYWSRKRAKSRPALNHSGKYMLGVCLMMAGMQFSNFWIPQTWLFVALKFMTVFAVLSTALWVMRRETITSRIKDGNEQAS
ncbi:hypothetical protein [Arthrobacter sp. MYb213]|uniref:hypothetical protein n=1 Tax=Arthrobacter sp. MYb213 TaxID=1848595 RepID=UPI000CFC0390|nr:hypothetical protein [Arthrobacter sp. MYb213]PRB69407.1 hypothetical protein CQ011_11570 [Arthrobacter sp. MYb213]